jgi:DNA-binding transcriptional ArsR family regulator
VTAWKSAGEVDHPVRVAILEALDWVGEPCSPVQLAPCLDERPATVNYHVRVLFRDGVLALASKHPQRGAIEYRYRLAAS